MVSGPFVYFLRLVDGTVTRSLSLLVSKGLATMRAVIGGSDLQIGGF